MEAKFSYFKAPVTTRRPSFEMTIPRIYKGITSNYNLEQTITLRQIAELGNKDANDYKKMAFDFVTFSGIFLTRKAENLVSHSGLICIDLDHIPATLTVHTVTSLKEKILKSTELDIALCFTSPSGDGLKVVAIIDMQRGTHQEWFQSISNYFTATWGITPDKSGSDVCRACFIPWDPDCYINPQFLQQ